MFQFCSCRYVTLEIVAIFRFDSTVAPLVYSDQFLQISTSLISSYLYGLGEVVDTLNRGTAWKRYVMYNRDQIPVANGNLYGSHPFFMSLDKMGKAYGVLLANSNAMGKCLKLKLAEFISLLIKSKFHCNCLSQRL